MSSDRGFRVSGQTILGIAALVFGVVFLLDNMDILDARQYVPYWPVFLIAFGLLRVFQPRGGAGSRVWGLIFVIIGGVLLLRTLGLSDIGFRELWPLILVLIGASLLWGSSYRSRVIWGTTPPADPHSLVSGFAVLGGFQRSLNSQDFRGGELSAIMGGCEVDLRQASIKEPEAVINTFAFWGGIKIKVPTSWSVSLQGFPFLGGYDDKTSQPSDPTAKRLVIKGTAIMGGVEVTN
ncbi:MAG: DUF5668 domain-containing protein [Bacteroidota bacterium]